MADETEKAPPAPAVEEGEECEECLFDGADKLRAGLSLLLGIVLIGIAVDVLSGGEVTRKLRGRTAE